MSKVDFNSITLGTDPEVFVVASTGVVAATVLTTGTKEKPELRNIGSDLGDFEVLSHNDNVMLEFSIPPSAAATTLNITAVDMIWQKLYLALEMFKTRARIIGTYKIIDKSCVQISKALAESKEGKEFGCSPDMVAHDYGVDRCIDLNATAHSSFRMAGGHIHFGGDDMKSLSEEEKARFVRCLDFYVYPFFFAYDGSIRIAYYGRPGSYRTKPYGLEYRSPSNYWIFSKKRVEIVIELIKKSVAAFNEGKDFELSAIQAEAARVDAIVKEKGVEV